MDYDDENRKDVLAQMMGELDNEHVNDLKKPTGPVKGVEITISVAPKTDGEMPEGMSEGGEVACPVCEEFGCANPDHAQMAGEGDIPKAEDENQNYIQQLLKSLDDDRR